jgi:hypothetical protein
MINQSMLRGDEILLLRKADANAPSHGLFAAIVAWRIHHSL